MIPRHRKLLAGVLLLGLVDAACTTVPILDPPRANLPANPGRTETDVANAIKQAALQLRWEVREDGPGQMTATLHLRSHVAVVSIHYDANSYEIRYADSTNLDHQGNQIHRNYNKWVKNLDARIRKQLGYE
jgi:hypothetical protein